MHCNGSLPHSQVQHAVAPHIQAAVTHIYAQLRLYRLRASLHLCPLQQLLNGTPHCEPLNCNHWCVPSCSGDHLQHSQQRSPCTTYNPLPNSAPDSSSSQPVALDSLVHFTLAAISELVPSTTDHCYWNSQIPRLFQHLCTFQSLAHAGMITTDTQSLLRHCQIRISAHWPLPRSRCCRVLAHAWSHALYLFQGTAGCHTEAHAPSARETCLTASLQQALPGSAAQGGCLLR